jgi:hypothetical protein
MIAIIKRNTAPEIVSIYRLTNGHQIILIRAALELESGEGLIWQLDCMAHTRGIARLTQKSCSPASQKQKTRATERESALAILSESLRILIMNSPELSHLSPQERATYAEGMEVVQAKLYEARLLKPTAEEIHQRSLSIGISQNRAKLAKARGVKAPQFFPSRKCYDASGRKILTTGGANPYYRNGRHCISSGSII